MRKTVRRPRVDFDARGKMASHGLHVPVRGVWHTTECGDARGITELEGVINFWGRQGLGYGAQILIDKDGNSALGANPTSVVWAVENRNTGTVSVELIGFARFVPKLWFLRTKQLNKLARWMAWLHKEHGVPITFDVDKGWSGHADQTKKYGGSHWDPGTGFPKRWVLRRAHKYRAEGWD